MEKIGRIVSALSRTLDQIGGLVILPAIFFVVIVDVILRYVFNAPFIWSLEFNEWMLLVMFMMAIPECTRQNGHIRMELIVANLSPRLQSGLDVVYVLCGMGVFILLAWHSWKEFLYNYNLNRVTEYLQLPLWLHHLIIVAVCVLLIVYYALRLVTSVLGANEFSRAEATGIED